MTNCVLYQVNPWSSDAFDVLSKENIRSVGTREFTKLETALETISDLSSRVADAYKEMNAIVLDYSSGIALEPLKELVTPISRPIALKDDVDYRLIGVRWYGEGPYIKETKNGRSIKAAKLFKAEKGDLIVSRLFAWKGSIAVIDSNCHEAVASNEFPMYISSKEIGTDYIGSILQTPSIWSDINILCTGSSKQSRNRVHEDDFGLIQIPIIQSKGGRALYLSRVNNIRILVKEIRRLSDIANVVGFLQRANDYKAMNLKAVEMGKADD